MTRSRATGPPSKAERAGRLTTQTNTHARWKSKLDHFQNKAREWAAAGDTIEAENCYQHAEHYLRMLQSAASA